MSNILFTQHILGLDPALPLFIFANKNDKLDASDAIYVDVYHSNAFVQGQVERCGTVDFYMNGGIMQPGCVKFGLSKQNETYLMKIDNISSILFFIFSFSFSFSFSFAASCSVFVSTVYLKTKSIYFRSICVQSSSCCRLLYGIYKK